MSFFTFFSEALGLKILIAGLLAALVGIGIAIRRAADEFFMLHCNMCP